MTEKQLTLTDTAGTVPGEKGTTAVHVENYKKTFLSMLSFSKDSNRLVYGKRAMVIALIMCLLAFVIGAWVGQRRQLRAIEDGYVVRNATRVAADFVPTARGIRFVPDNGDNLMNLADSVKS